MASARPTEAAIASRLWGGGVALVAAVALVAGCAPTCAQVCAKLDRCGVVDGLNRLECEESCDREMALYELEGDDVAASAFDDHRACIGGSSCDELDAGTCYDAELFPF